jgi:hypothetical protein
MDGNGLVMTGAAFNSPPTELASFDDGVPARQLTRAHSIGGFSINRVRTDVLAAVGRGSVARDGAQALIRDMIVFDDGRARA